MFNFEKVFSKQNWTIKATGKKGRNEVEIGMILMIIKQMGTFIVLKYTGPDLQPISYIN